MTKTDHKMSEFIARALAKEIQLADEAIARRDELILWLWGMNECGARIYRLHPQNCGCPYCEKIADLEIIIGEIPAYPLKSIK